MSLFNLSAHICRVFSESGNQRMRTIQKVKDDQRRDVVTELDIKLHEVSQQFVKERLPNCRLLSEEGGNTNLDVRHLLDGDWLVVDPLDGSNNHALGLPNYGYMAAHIQSSRITGAVIVLPEHNQYIIFDGAHGLYAQPIPILESSESSTVYYGYPPRQNPVAQKARYALQDLIDTDSAGMYRYGSACAGLYNLLTGKHMAFIGHELRLWDALAYLPILVSRQIEVRYCIKGLSITLLAGTKPDFIEGAAQILQQHQNLTLHKYFHNDTLRVDSL